MSNWDFILQGDVEAAVIHELLASSHITGFSGGAPRISGDLVGYTQGLRWIKVSREGGNVGWPKVDRPRVDFNVYGPTRTVAHDMAQVAQAVMFQAAGTAYPSYGIFISDVQVETGLFRSPEKETGASRYIFSLRLACVPI